MNDMFWVHLIVACDLYHVLAHNLINLLHSILWTFVTADFLSISRHPGNEQISQEIWQPWLETVSAFELASVPPICHYLMNKEV